MPRLSKIGAAALAAFGWTGLNTVSASYLVVAGGGGGGDSYGGGGGAGGYLTGTTSLNPTQSYTVTVGAGGAGSTSSSLTGNQGSNSVFNAITSTGGGGGGSANDVLNSSTSIGANGGSGGGGAANASGGTVTRAGGSGNTPSTSPSQGNNGGSGVTDSATYRAAGGGGGSFAVGSNGTSGVAGAGGAGTPLSISGASVTYAGGGGGGGFAVTQGAGGTGGGGAGGVSTSTAPVAGTANLGGGGGGAGDVTTFNGASGGSGVVIISYPSPQKFGGGIVTTSGANTIHTFQTSGTLAPLSSLTASYLIVAGGGSGGGQIGGGGGAGGYLSGSGVTIDTNSIYVVSVGSGGTGTAAGGTNGTNSTFSIVSTAAVGGGAGGSSNGAIVAGNGGSGGGGGGFGTAFGTGTVGQGNDGGVSIGAGAPYYPGGGGGGASSVGGNATSTVAGVGGTGTASSISGASVTYAAGASGGRYNTGSSNGVAGTANTGNGGSGSSTASAGAGEVGGNGGSGIVIISYAGATQLMAGGTVTISGGNVIHTFTSSGYLAPLKFVGNSLRFRASNNNYLARTYGTPTDNKVWTWSAWIKRGSLSLADANHLFMGSLENVTGNPSVYTRLVFETDNTLRLQSNGSAGEAFTSSAVYRDPAAWYHIVLSMNASGTVVNCFVNGTEITYASRTNPTNTNTAINRASYFHRMGFFRDAEPRPFDGYMTEINFIDGQALTPNSFGTFNSYGVWQPITYGGSYGTNGFYLPFNGRNSTYSGGFNGTNQYLSLSGFTPNWSTYTNFTVEMWIYVAAYPSVVAKVFGTEPAGSGGAYSIGYFDSTGTLAFGISTVNQFSSASGAISTGKWTHLAYVRNGSNLNIYVNGTSVASTTSASTYCSNNTNTFLIGQAATYYLNGSISNFRFTNTAVYTGTFVPQTSPLTAISGTQLLTLQNATIIDNSTNAYTITNNNTVAMTAGTNIFANPVSLAADQSPAGNNWTANNISTTTGSTYDSMTDVPTLTSTTAANYCTWNPLDKSGTSYIPTISNGNLSFAAGSAGQFSPCRGTQFVSSGKWYFEVTITNNGTFSGQVGVANNYNIYQSGGDNSVSSSGGVGVAWDGRGFLYYTGSSVAFTPTFTTNDVISCAFDADTGKTWFRKNGGSWYDSSGGTTGDPATGANPVYTYTAGTSVAPFANGVSPHTQNANFGQQPFTYTAPTDFIALNTFNL